MSHRITPVYYPKGSNDVADQIREHRGAIGITPLDGALLRSSPIANGWNQLLGALRKVRLSADIRELIVSYQYFLKNIRVPLFICFLLQDP